MSTISTGTSLTTAFVINGDTTGELVVKTGAGASTALTLSATGTLSLATGNLTFSSTGQRITGDFSNATASSRLSFQSSTTNGNTILQAIPNGTATQTNLLLYANTDLANTAALNIFQNATESTVRAIALGTGSYTPMNFYTGGSERMRLDTSGNLGIGTASPVQRLTVESTSDVRATIRNSTENTSYASSLDFATGSGSLASTNVVARVQGLITQADPSALQSALAFHTNSGDSVTEKMRIDASGNVGIGTNNPLRRLDIANGGLAFTESGGASRSIHWGDTTNIYPILISGTATTGNCFLTFNTNTFGSAATERMRITSGGLVGIGTASPNVGLEVVSAASENSRSLRVAYDTTYYYEIRNLGAAGNRIRSNNGSMTFNITGTDYAVLTTGGEFITGGTTDQGAYNLQCNGTGVWGAGAYVNGSDARLKDNIQSLDSGLDVVKAMRPVTFQYKPEYSKDQSVQPGFIAQELQQAMAGKPYLEGVVQEGTNHLNVAYQNIIPILVKAIQELEAKVAALEAK